SPWLHEFRRVLVMMSPLLPASKSINVFTTGCALDTATAAHRIAAVYKRFLIFIEGLKAVFVPHEGLSAKWSTSGIVLEHPSSLTQMMHGGVLSENECGDAR